ncbi:putative palmitoyltransferase zdhhc4 [Phytophthora pseudosyringae]|uniref:Putative palmitoyltransferase zdhhc4 n=1 Tax=Phytophthora pseudosyringae TaxID=221518 RepID=A0A8T1WDT4_9STRA|nr:putative palmitoyltransferase zdhhc4 [Phytophthora pseudosyringae]
MTITTRSKRVSAFGTGAPTPATVAPGSYATEQVITSFGVRAGRPLFSSFATSEKRNLNENKTTSAITPGPGAYIDEARHQHGLPPSNVFATKISRFAPSAPGSTIFRASSVQDNPGPGSYLRPASSPPSNNQREHQGPHKFAHLVKPSVPAIPQRQQCYGYVQVGVELQRQSPPEEIYSGVGQDTVGPAAYSRHNPIWNEKKNVAPSLKSTAKRDVWEENKRLTTLPGPGQYNTNSVPEITVATAPKSPTSTPEGQRPRIGARRSQHRGARQSAVFASRVPILPTPKPVGVYDPEREQELFAKEERAERYRQDQNKVGGYGAKTEAFGSTTARTEVTSQISTPFSHPSYMTTPGPGRYGAAATNAALKRQERKFTGGGSIPHHRTDGIGFSCATERPCLAPTKTPAAPGPGTYKSETPRSLNQTVKGKLCIGRNGVFGTTSERQVWGDLDAEEFTPGPGAYSDSGSFNATQYLNSAAFKSGSTRFAKNTPPHAPPHVHCVGDQVTPAVGQYNVSKGFSAVASSAPGPLEGGVSAPDTAGLLSPRVPFLSTQERSVFNTKDVCDLPGPGAYKDSADDAGAGYTRSKDVRLTVGNEARFRVKPTVPVAVGPGAYSIPGTVGTKSFNVTMARKNQSKSGPTRARGSPIQKTYPVPHAR